MKDSGNTPLRPVQTKHRWLTEPDSNTFYFSWQYLMVWFAIPIKIQYYIYPSRCCLMRQICTFYICRVTSDFIKTALSTICAEQLNMCVIFPALLYHKCLFSVKISFKFTCISFFLIILQIFFSRIENLCRLI